MTRLLFSGLKTLRTDRADLALENLALRQQLLVLQRNHPKPRALPIDRLFWVILSKLWAPWKQVLKVFRPKTVIGWQRGLFSGYWRWISRPKGGRPNTNPATIDLIKQMWTDNRTWGAPKIRRELLKLGIRVAHSTIQKYRPEPTKTSDQRWTTFLRNHLDSVAAVDFFTVPTVTFGVLYVFVVMLHDRRRALHFNITESPSAFWTSRQVIEAFPFTTPPKYLLRDNDGIYGFEVSRKVKALGMDEAKIAPRSPWQSPYVERLIGTIRRECLDHFIIFNQGQLHRILTRYMDYYHRIRPHKSLEDDLPEGREIQDDTDQEIVALPILGGLYHHYIRRAA